MQYEKVRTAVIGCGTISNIYIRNLSKLFSIIDLVALCDLNLETAKEKAALYGIPRVMTLDEIAEDPDIELAVCLTPVPGHASVIRRMLKAGKHVFSEKMLTEDLQDARELTALAAELGLQLGCAPDTSLGAGVQTARYAVDKGLIGQPTSCLISLNRDQSLLAESFRFLQQKGGALPFDMGGYYLSAMLMLLGSVEAVQAFASPALPHTPRNLYRGDSKDSFTIPGPAVMTGGLRFASGVLGSIHLNGSSANPEKPILTVYGTEGRIELGDPNTFRGPVTLVRANGQSCVLPLTHGYDGTPVLPDPTPWETVYGHRGIGAAELAWSVRKGRPARLGGSYGLHSMEILFGMTESAETGKAVSIESRVDLRPLPPGYYSAFYSIDGSSRGDAELSLAE